MNQGNSLYTILSILTAVLVAITGAVVGLCFSDNALHSLIGIISISGLVAVWIIGVVFVGLISFKAARANSVPPSETVQQEIKDIEAVKEAVA